MWLLAILLIPPVIMGAIAGFIQIVLPLLIAHENSRNRHRPPVTANVVPQTVPNKEKDSQTSTSVTEKLKELERLKESGLITKKEYKKKRKEILAEM